MSFKVKRRQKLVNQHLQLYFAIHLTAFFLLCAVVVVIDYYIAQELIMAQHLSASLAHHVATEEAQVPNFYAMLISYVAVLLVLNLGFFYALSLYISQRIAGPIVNISRKLAQIKAGDLTQRVSLRKGDYLLEIEENLNALTQNLCDGIADIQEDIAALKDSKVVQEHEEIRSHLMHIDTTINKYITK